MIPHFCICKQNVMKPAQLKAMGKPNIFTISCKKSSPQQSSHYCRDAFRLLYHFMCGCLHSPKLMQKFYNLLTHKVCHTNLYFRLASSIQPLLQWSIYSSYGLKAQETSQCMAMLDVFRASPQASISTVISEKGFWKVHEYFTYKARVICSGNDTHNAIQSFSYCLRNC